MTMSTVKSVAITLATAAILAATGGAQGTRLTFELANAAGKTVKSSDFASRYLLLVYQGLP